MKISTTLQPDSRSTNQKKNFKKFMTRAKAALESQQKARDLTERQYDVGIAMELGLRLT